MDQPGLDKPLIAVCLILHDVLATGLLIVITGQVFFAWQAADARPFSRMLPQAGEGLCTLVIILFVASICLGGLLYPSYRFVVKPYLEANNMRGANGAFEIKEHFAALVLLALPAYREVWKPLSSSEGLLQRRILTSILCAIVWWNFAVGHLLNYISGLSR